MGRTINGGRRRVRSVLLGSGLFAVMAPVLFVAFFLVWPDVGALTDHDPETTAFIRRREHQWAREGKKITVRREWTPLANMARHVTDAVVIAEDDRFWSHDGFDFTAMRTAAERNWELKEFRYGASTISQQLVKNLYFSASKNPLRKVAEAVVTWRMERTLEKRRILELYLNLVEWGEGVFGIGAAAREYFGVTPGGLSAYQAAKLAAVLPNPLRLKVNGSGPYVERRARQILAIMQHRTVIPPQVSVPDDDVDAEEVSAETAPSDDAPSGDGMP